MLYASRGGSRFLKRGTAIFAIVDVGLAIYVAEI